MKPRRLPALCIVTALPFVLVGPAGAAGKAEIKGAAILDHPCGKVAVRQVGLVHAGKFDEANKLSTKEMQAQWKAMPAKDRNEMAGLAKDMSPSPEQFTAAVKANGVLTVDGDSAVLKATTTTKDKNGSSTETVTQDFKLIGTECLVSR